MKAVGLKAFDLRNGYDLSDPTVQDEVMSYIAASNPDLVVTSPPCDPFSQLNIHMNYPKQDIHRVTSNLEKGRAHMAFAMKCCEAQRQRCKYFVHEHPWLCASWDLEEVRAVLAHWDVILVRTDMCRFQLEIIPGELAMKPGGILTNSPEIAAQLDKRCQCPPGQLHTSLFGGGKAAEAAIYSKLFCRAVLRGFHLPLHSDSQQYVEIQTRLA
jgi:hypothetical protein